MFGEKAESGRYRSKSEVVRSAIRLLQDREKLREVKRQELREAVQKGLDSGSAGKLDMEAIKAEARERWEAEQKNTRSLKSTVRKSTQARVGLLGIWDYVARHTGRPERADRVLDRIEEACEVIGEHPKAGEGRPNWGGRCVRFPQRAL